MAELRFNPLLNDYIITASNRANRPTMPKDFCPFCVGSGKVPDDGYDVYKYDNDFPVMVQQESELSGYENDFFHAKPLYGKCEVILYHSNHTITLPELELSHIRKLVDLWCQRYYELSKDKNLKYIYIFENRGAEAGVTMPHPHGQLYAFSHIPKLIEERLSNSKKYYEEHNRCLICDIYENEKKSSIRMITENEHFAVYVPYFATFPYTTHLVSKKHTGSLLSFDDSMKDSFADILKKITGTYDTLFNKLFPYMMAFHQTPVNMDYDEKYYHFHVEFYPPLRAANTQYFRASCETGAGAYCNATSPEEKAKDLSDAYMRYTQK